MQRAVAIVFGATVTVGIELNDTAGVLADGDTNECCIGLAITLSKAVSITILNLTGVRVTPKVSLALEFAGRAPAVALDGEFAAVAGVVARGMVIREALVVDSVTGVVDNCKTTVVAVGVTARWTGDGREVTG